MLSAHPLVATEFQRFISPLRLRSVGRRLNIRYAAEAQSVSIPVASLYIIDSHSFGPATESLVAGIRHRYPKRHVIVLVEAMTTVDCFPLLRLGVKGLVTYRDAASHLANATRSVLDGGIWVPRDLMSRFLESGQKTPTAEVPATARKRLTRREQEVLECLLRNLSNKEIAESLHISESTVKFHVSNVISRFGVRRRADLLLHFLPEPSRVH
ncbi:MAG TPA: response regulator transcription factor [Terriglobia bacterium]|nr:response regulator transcription factor [Terriglobia bacterium]